MTRFLSDSLQAQEPFFRIGLRKLELSHGNPSHDIRLSAMLKQHVRQKILELGLDPSDTTPKELYHTLQSRLASDEKILTRTLQTRAATYVSAEGDIVSGMIHALKDLPDAKDCFAIKATSFKAIIQKMPPKKAMKALGYRSISSFLKHESPASILVVASVTEDSKWQHNLLVAYKKLQPKDFETREVLFTKADTSKWHIKASQLVAGRRHTLLSFKELGAVVFLPIPSEAPNGVVTASLTLALHQLNEIRSTSTFLKLSQVRADYGEIVQRIVVDEAKLNSRVLDRNVPWHLIQNYYHRFNEHFDEAVFEPHIQAEDMTSLEIEKTLSSIEPAMSFWHGTAHLGMNDDGKPVSMNIVDTALGFCNQVAYEQRLVNYYQKALWHELLIKYLSPAAIKQALLHEMQPKFAEELVTT